MHSHESRREAQGREKAKMAEAVDEDEEVEKETPPPPRLHIAGDTEHQPGLMGWYTREPALEGLELEGIPASAAAREAVRAALARSRKRQYA